MPHRALTNRLPILAMLVWLGLASNASALILTGGPSYTLPGGGSCSAAGVASQTGGATLSCTGVNLAAHTNVYFGLRNDLNVNGNTMTGIVPAAGSGAVFRYSSSTSNSITYTSTTTVADQINGTQPVSNQLVLTLTAGTASIVATGGFPVNNSFGDIERVFRITSASFSIRVDVRASNTFFGPGQACPAVYDPSHAPSSGSADISKADLAFYYSSCGDSQVDSPEQCDIGAGNGAAGTCCASNCTFRPNGSVCRAGTDLQCDTSEACTGSAASCPPDDAPIHGGNVCRPGSGDICDENELCTGVPGQGCPADDAPGKTGTQCRASGGGDVCDEAEHCTGTPGGTCPADDAPGNLNLLCRPGSGDMCDPDERCTGVPNQGCPADVVANPSTVCRTGSGDSCDPDETCTAIPLATCPANVVSPAGTECRAANGTCDVAEQCTGTTGATCPADVFAPAETACDQDANVCTIDACDGNGMCLLDEDAMLCGDGDIDGSCGEQCDDGNVDGGDGCSATCQIESPLECSTVPRIDCIQPYIAGKGSLMVKRGTTPDRDLLKWKWSKGSRTTVAELGTPQTTTNYRLCIYDASGLRRTLNAPAGGICGAKPCWKPLGASGFTYKDKQLTPEGIQQLKLKSGPDGKAQIQLAGRGTLLALPDLSSVVQPVRFQLRNSDGECWDAAFSAPATVHTGAMFKDKSD
jgi:cysteine-rich repeat protein